MTDFTQRLTELLGENAVTLEELLRALGPYSFSPTMGPLVQKIRTTKNREEEMQNQIKILTAYIAGLEQKSPQK